MSVGVAGHETAEGEAFFEEVCQTINQLGQSGCAYWREWTGAEMLVWDNWRMLHAVEGCDAQYERRTLRTTIEGDYGLGCFEGGKAV